MWGRPQSPAGGHVDKVLQHDWHMVKGQPPQRQCCQHHQTQSYHQSHLLQECSNLIPKTFLMVAAYNKECFPAA